MRVARRVAARIIDRQRLRRPPLAEARRVISSSPLFDPAFYLARNPHLAEARLDPLDHYLLYGAGEGRDPHPLFDAAYYVERYPEARGAAHPLLHFLQEGARRRLDPHRLFDTAYYLDRNPDVRASGTNPLAHFVEFGDAEDRDPHPLFDLSHWRGQNASAPANALAHYVTGGWREPGDPHPLFSTSFYRAHNPDVGEMNALLHFLQYGGREGRDPHPLFDTSWYLIRNPVVAERGINPLAHFVIEGARQGRDPRPAFDCAFYARRYGTGEVNPLEEFVRNGAAEGRLPNPRFRLWPEGRRNRRNLRALYAALARQSAPSGDCAIGADEYRDWLARYETASDGEGSGPLVSVVRAANGAERRAAMRAADGHWIAAIGPADVLAANALPALAAHVRSDPDAAVVYADDDVIDAIGERLRPHFKPDWNRDLFYSSHYTDGLVFFRRDALDRIGAFEPDAAGSSGVGAQLFAEMLRMIETGARISHLPGVFLHRYCRAGDRVRGPSEDGAAAQNDSRVRLLSAHFQRQGIAAEVRSRLGRYRSVAWPLPEPAPLVSLIVPTRDRVDLLRRCLEGVMNGTTYPHVDLIVVDNESTDPATLAYLEGLRGRRGVAVLQYPHAINYSAINNLAARHARGSLLCLLNNDVEVVHADWLERMVRYFSRPEVGVVGAKLYYPGDRVQHAGIVIGLGGVAGNPFRLLGPRDPGYFGRAVVTQELSAVTAAAMLVRRTVFEEVGGLDERQFKVAFNDIDFCLRIRGRGHRIVYAPDVELRHQESASLGPPLAPGRSDQFRRERLAFQERWPDFIDDDPHYNPNLSLERDYRLAEPPRARHR